MKRVLFLLIVVVALVGCSTTQYYKTLGGVDTTEVEIGMTQEEFREIAPRPDSINRTVTQGGAQEQWVYHVGGYDTQYFYFDESGRLTSYQSGAM